MKERVLQREQMSRTLDVNQKSARQMSVIDMLNQKQTFNNDILQKKGSEVIQRIIVVDNVNKIDFGMIVNVYQMLSNNIDQRVTLLTILSQSNLAGEQIGMQGHGHGSTGTFGGINAESLAQFLQKAGVDNSNTVIDLLSCRSGSGGDLSYAASFAQGLRQLGIESIVYANKGLGVTMNDGYGYSKRERTKEEQAEYDSIFIECNNEVEEAKKIAQTAKVSFDQIISIDSLSGAQKEQEIRKIFLIYGKRILEVANNLFSRLYAHQQKLIAHHDDPDKGLYIKTTYDRGSSF